MPGSLLGESSHSLLGREVPKNALGVMPFLWGVMPDSLLGGVMLKSLLWRVMLNTLLGGVMLKSLLGES